MCQNMEKVCHYLSTRGGEGKLKFRRLYLNRKNNIAFTVRVVKHWNVMSREAVESLYLESQSWTIHSS